MSNDNNVATWPTEILPDCWIWSEFFEIFHNVTSSDKKIKQKDYLSTGKYPIIDQGQDIISGFCDDASLVYGGTLPILIFGDHTRCVKYVDFKFVQGADGVKVLLPNPNLIPKFYYFGMKTLTLPNKGYSRHFKYLKPTKFPLPPVNEQRRIVAKIEALQARSRAVKAALDAIPPMLERFRQSVLASAFRGDLTKAWREQNPDVEPASVLLERIRAERRTKWIADEAEKIRARAEKNALKKGKAWGEAENAKALETGMQKATAKYTAPEPVDATDLPELPTGWVWTSLSESSSITGGLTRNKSKRSKSKKRIPLVTVASVGLRKIKKDKFGEVGLLESDGNNAKLNLGDILIVEGNGSLGHIGRAALWDGCVTNARHQNHLIKVKPYLGKSEYILEWLSSPIGRYYLVAQATSASGLYSLSLTKVGKITVPLPSLNEQKEIVSKIEQYFDLISNIEAQVEQARARLATLDQAILAKAFRGELVPQDPNDEPASVLLERIRAERERLEAEKKAAKKSASKSKKAGTNSRRKSTKKVTPKTDTIQTTKAPIIGADGQIKLDFDAKEQK